MTPVAPPVRFTDTILLRGALLVSFDPPAVTRQDLMVSNGLVTATGCDLKPPHNCDVIDANGLVLMPGFVDLRADLLSEPLPGFHDLNAAARPCMGEESVIWAGFAAGLRALRAGTTCAFAMQAAPGFALGALPRLREVLLTLGLRGVLAYKAEAGREGAAAASRDAALYGGGEQLRMAVGCGDAAAAGPLLKELAALAERGQVPFFGEAGLGGNGKEAVAALKAAGLLNHRSIVSVGGGLLDADAAAMRADGVTLVQVPPEDLAAGRALGPVPLDGVGVGSGCGTADVLGAARLGMALARGRGAPQSCTAALAMISVGHRVASQVFGLPFGSFAPGSAADFVLWRYAPGMPLTAETVAEHVLEGLRSAQIDSVIVNGRFVIRNGKLQTLEESAVLFAAQRGAIDLHQRLTGHDWPGLAAVYAAEQHGTPAPVQSDDESAGDDFESAMDHGDWDDDEADDDSDDGADDAAETPGEGETTEAPEAQTVASSGAAASELMEWPDEDDLDGHQRPAPAAASTTPEAVAPDGDTDADDEDDDDDADDEDDGHQDSTADSFGFGVFS